MNSSNSSLQKAVLTIAGSDSGGGAGIQADLKTFDALGVFGASALTCITAQNPDGVAGIVPLEASFVELQIRQVCESFPIVVAKTGMLYSADIINVVAAEDIREGLAVLVVDPVMVTAAGDRLLQADAIEALCEALLPKARVITPNLHEAEILCGHSISSVEELRDAAREIGERFDVACVCKGGHLPGSEVVDVLYDEGQEQVFSSPRVDVRETHGAGCSFSAALTAFLARGQLISDAVQMSRDYVRLALARARSVGRHTPLNFREASRILQGVDA